MIEGERTQEPTQLIKEHSWELQQAPLPIFRATPKSWILKDIFQYHDSSLSCKLLRSGAAEGLTKAMCAFSCSMKPEQAKRSIHALEHGSHDSI